jgi:hypothetical protein
LIQIVECQLATLRTNWSSQASPNFRVGYRLTYAGRYKREAALLFQ